MTRTHLTASYKDRLRVKELGARWDAELRTWYVPAGMDLTPFSAWLPTQVPSAVGRTTNEESGTAEIAALAGAELSALSKGIALSALLNGVAQAVSQAFSSGIWTRAEVVKADVRKGHVYLELAERNGAGATLAQARAMIWSAVANKILPEFERATGVVLGSGIKLLIRAKPSISPMYGMSLVIDAIDPDYTLGDLEAKKREIRARLQREGVFDANRLLPTPWDYREVIVVAPEQAAGLGDFKAEAARLEQYGVCRFTYVHSRFQGEGAAEEIHAALTAALRSWSEQKDAPLDAVVIIRGGGAVNDLAWLNDYPLARLICDLEIPVLTGIGHERDSTLLDEVAHISFDTPSKVIAGIEQLIARRANEAVRNFEEIITIASRHAIQVSRSVDSLQGAVALEAQRNLSLAREGSAELMSGMRVHALGTIHEASEQSRAHFESMRLHSSKVVASAQQLVPTRLAEVRSESRRIMRAAETEIDARVTFIQQKAAADVRLSKESAARALQDVEGGALRIVADARQHSDSLIREIAGQGPDKTLGRGFAIVRAADGSTIASAATTAKTAVGAAIKIEFHDGVLSAQTVPTRTREI